MHMHEHLSSKAVLALKKYSRREVFNVKFNPMYSPCFARCLLGQPGQRPAWPPGGWANHRMPAH